MTHALPVDRTAVGTACLPWCRRAQWLVANLGKVCWVAGGCCLLCGLVLALLTVQLAEDPDRWPDAPPKDAVLTAARDMLNADAGFESPYGGRGSYTGAVVVGGAPQPDVERQGLLQYRVEVTSEAAEAASASSAREIEA